MAETTKYLSYEGLRTYNEQIRKLYATKEELKALFAELGWYSKEEVDAMVKGVRDYVDEAIAAAFSKAETEGKANDIRTYATKADFPETGVADVEYIDAETGTEYHWVVDTDSQGGRYEAINEVVSSADIEGLFGSDIV